MISWTLAHLENHQRKSDQHHGLKEERNRGADYEDGSVTIPGSFATSPGLTATSTRSEHALGFNSF
jgi:hypothetical protein